MTVERIELRPGYSISRIIKGGWQLAGGHGTFNRSDAINDMIRFIDAGITTFDCADIYLGVEEMIGEAIQLLRRRDGHSAADAIEVHTKLVPDLARLDKITNTEIEAIIDRSLMRLNLDQLHLVQFYWWDLSIGNPLAALDYLKTLRAKGKIKYLACTNWDEAAMQPFVDQHFDLVTAQVQYSLLDARPAGAFSEWCQSNRIQILCYGVLAGGFLSDSWLGKNDPGYQFENRSLIKYRLIIKEFGDWTLFQKLLTTLAEVGKRHQTGISTIAVAYMLRQPVVAAAIVGARTASHLDQTLSVFDIQLTDEDLKQITGVLEESDTVSGPVYGLESDRNSSHGRIMKYNLNST
ncbi:aldo/keto reductase [Chromatiales bacterium (ex Bugula neritina AB1)]|nr:aldo/keto reductase [Chromatiales bacterium (ex Bugula neritina AB1)]